MQQLILGYQIGPNLIADTPWESIDNNVWFMITNKSPQLVRECRILVVLLKAMPRYQHQSRRAFDSQSIGYSSTD